MYCQQKKELKKPKFLKAQKEALKMKVRKRQSRKRKVLIFPKVQEVFRVL